MNRLRAGVVGLGKRATEDHLPGIAGSRHVELAAVCDSNEQLATTTAQGLNVAAYTEYREMLARERLDFVVITVPHAWHWSIIQAAAGLGVHVLKEKPFAISLAQARDIMQLCDTSRIHLMTTLQRRFNPIYTSWAQLAHLIGTPFFIDVKYTMFIPNPHEGWRGTRSLAGGGCILDMGYHMIDLLIWYLGLPHRVYARISTKAIPRVEYDAEDTASICLEYENGPHGVFVLSRFQSPPTEMVRLVGSEGILELSRGSIRRYSSSGEVLDELKRSRGWPSAAATQIDYFAEVIRGTKQNIGGPASHLPHMAFVEACYQSAKTDRAVDPAQLLEL